MKILNTLNESQRAAAQHIDGPMLILAGAGSGKTKTITTRLAYLIDEVGIPPQNTLTLTFTNKAAQVMRERALSLIKKELKSPPLLCTFHKFGLLFLRLHIKRLRRNNNFTVIDSDDVKKIIKNIKDILNDKENSVATIIEKINYFKDSLADVKKVYEAIKMDKSENLNKEYWEKMALFYEHYQNYLLKYNFVDFDDLLFLSYQILNQDEEFAKSQSNIYRYITVDEYQDTNHLQFALIKKLCSAHENICVVGDDDQSIYGWRGAKVENILNFQNEFQNVKLVKLEQNYRSVGTILQAANNLIAHNEKRLGKNLICTQEKGEEIEFIENESDMRESEFIAEKIKTLLQAGTKASEIAILYRINAFGLMLEKTLIKENIPYKIVSGVRFYDRAEIKDAIAYLRFLNNLDDDFSFKRIINRPKRGLGQVALSKIENYAQRERISMFEALCNLDGSKIFSHKVQGHIEKFIEQIKKLREITDLKILLDELKTSFDFKSFYEEQDNVENRWDNVEEFYALLKDEIDREKYTRLDEILNDLSLASDQDGVEGNCVYLMSIHASKGLEFEQVFTIGLEEGFFPLINETSDLEEERRLAYVAFTRAKNKLWLSFCSERFFRGSRAKELQKSRFLTEAKIISKTEDSLENSDKDFKKGDLVKHKIFGIGRISNVGKDKLSINFGGIERVLLSSFVEKICE